MIFPTNIILFLWIPSFLKFILASADGVNNRSDSLSVTTLLISSGIVRSKLLKPASTWATLRPSLAATSEQAKVELTSPTTTIQSGLSFRQTGSKANIILAVCSACEPEPTPRLMSGAGMPSSLKKISDILRS